jgi:hypothetical protein
VIAAIEVVPISKKFFETDFALNDPTYVDVYNEMRKYFARVPAWICELPTNLEFLKGLEGIEEFSKLTRFSGDANRSFVKYFWDDLLTGTDRKLRRLSDTEPWSTNARNFTGSNKMSWTKY